MNRFRLNLESQRFIQSDTGMDCSLIANSDVAVIDKNIEKHTDAVLKPALSVGNISPRGSVYLMLKRFFTDSKINEKLAKIAP